METKECYRDLKDLTEQFHEIYGWLKEEQTSVILTADGKLYLVLLSCGTYENMKTKIEVFESLMKAEEDEREGRVTSITETFDELERMLEEK